MDACRAGTLVTLRYATEFARGRGDETFVFRTTGGTAKLAGYHINSIDFMMRGHARGADDADNASDAAEADKTENEVVAIRPLIRR